MISSSSRKSCLTSMQLSPFTYLVRSNNECIFNIFCLWAWREPRASESNDTKIPPYYGNSLVPQLTPERKGHKSNPKQNDPLLAVRWSHHHSLPLLHSELHGPLHYLENKVGLGFREIGTRYTHYAIIRKLHTHINVLVSILLSLQIIIAPLVGKHPMTCILTTHLNLLFQGLSTPGYLLLFQNQTINTASSIIWRIAFIFNCFTEVNFSYIYVSKIKWDIHF